MGEVLIDPNFRDGDAVKRDFGNTTRLSARKPTLSGRRLVRIDGVISAIGND
jgi:hypothetical protein